MTIRTLIIELPSAECQAVLERHHVGRLAFMRGGHVDIVPIGYVARDKWIFLRSAYGGKLDALSHNPFGAFEVDDVKGPGKWESVVAHGTIYMLPADGAPIEKCEFARALAALRRVAPETLTPGDPTPDRNQLYGLHVDRISGRAAR